MLRHVHRHGTHCIFHTKWCRNNRKHYSTFQRPEKEWCEVPLHALDILSLTQNPTGKNWHPLKSAFRPTSGQTSYTKRMVLLKSEQATKSLEREMKEEKAAERDRRVQAIKDRRKAKEEKERYEKMAEKMHRKIVERRKRREKRNTLLKSGK